MTGSGASTHPCLFPPKRATPWTTGEEMKSRQDHPRSPRIFKTIDGWARTNDRAVLVDLPLQMWAHRREIAGCPHHQCDVWATLRFRRGLAWLSLFFLLLVPSHGSLLFWNKERRLIYYIISFMGRLIFDCFLIVLPFDCLASESFLLRMNNMFAHNSHCSR